MLYLNVTLRRGFHTMWPIHQFGCTCVIALALFPGKAACQKLAPVAATASARRTEDRPSMPAIAIEASNHRPVVVGTIVGAIVGGAAGAYQARSEERQTACAGTLTTPCVGTNNYFRYMSIGAIVGGLIGALVGASTL